MDKLAGYASEIKDTPICPAGNTLDFAAAALDFVAEKVFDPPPATIGEARVQAAVTAQGIAKLGFSVVLGAVAGTAGAGFIGTAIGVWNTYCEVVNYLGLAKTLCRAGKFTLHYAGNETN